MQVSGFVKFNQNIALIATTNDFIAANEGGGGPWSKVAGNPTLQPRESNNFDWAFEYYFDGEGYVSAALFYKDLVNWTRQNDQIIDFTNDSTADGANYFIPGFHDRIANADGNFNDDSGAPYAIGDCIAPPDLGRFSSFEDGNQGSVSGLEFRV
jgi:iron complex outermembrane receptor protein